MEETVDKLPQPSSAVTGEPKDKIKTGEAGVKIAENTLREEFGELVEEKVIDEVCGLIKILPRDTFVQEMPIRTEGDEDMIGYRTIDGKLALDADAMESEDHAFQAAYHEFLEELSARLGTNLRSFHKLHEGIVQYFVRQAAKRQGRRYHLSAYEGTSNIVARLIEKGVSENLWKKALVNNQMHEELMERTNEVQGDKMGFREIDWALDRDDWPKIKRLTGLHSLRINYNEPR